jgi:phosphatidylglycerophosphatase A
MFSRFICAVAAWISSGFGSGYAQVAPGTFGSAAALMFWWLLYNLGTLSSPQSQVVLIAVTIVVGTAVIGICVRKETDADPQWIVIDEWAGLFIALFGLYPAQWALALVGFVAFRIFDATKMGPVGWAEKLPREHGIMADDIVAGALSALVVWGIRAACSL